VSDGSRPAEVVSAAPARTFGHAEVFAAIGLLSFAAARFLPVLSIPLVCPARALTGLPCPTCGMTHAFVAVAHGDLAAAVAASPAGALLAALAWILSAADLVRLVAGAPLPVVPERTARLLVASGTVALGINWAWMLARELLP
jgi:hypothetical protein